MKFKFVCKTMVHIVQSRRKLKKGQKPERGEAYLILMYLFFGLLTFFKQNKMVRSTVEQCNRASAGVRDVAVSDLLGDA